MMFPSHPTCKLCPLHAAAHHVGIPTHWVADSLPPGPNVPSVFFISQNPGVEEDRQGKHSVGESGKFFHEIYIDGLDLRKRTSIYLVNGVRCGPHVEKNIGPYNKCRPYLLADIIQICKAHNPCPPRLVFIAALPLRAFLRAVTGEPNVTQQQSFGMQGRLIEIDYDGEFYPIHFFSCENPMVPMKYNPPSIRTVNDHLSILDRHLTKKIVAPVTEPNIVEPRMPE